jgi:transcriptional regulator with XRE-family HTH domain
MPSGTLSEPTTALGARIRALRQGKGFAQWQLAYVVGTRANRISDWEIGSREPTLPSLQRLAAAFGITVADLLEGVM